MKDEDYIKHVKDLESKDIHWDKASPRLLHAVFGMVTESVELQDAIKKSLFYGKELDKENLLEEFGDFRFYYAMGCDELGFSDEEVKDVNVKKQRKRYGEKFSKEKAINRDLKQERDILEEGLKKIVS